MTWGVDSASSELGEVFPIQDEDIDQEEHPSEDHFIPTANQSRSPVSEQSCTCPEQQVYSSDMF
jgi:hypothetical protein